MKRTLSCIFICFSLLLAAGCSDNVGLKGKVTFSDTGDPLPMGEIYFSTETFMARAPIQSNGTYTVGTLSANDGLPAGTYDVTIIAVDPNANKMTDVDRKKMPTDKSSGSLIDTKYAVRATSGLKATVDKSTRTLDFKVDRAKN